MHKVEEIMHYVMSWVFIIPITIAVSIFGVISLSVIFLMLSSFLDSEILMYVTVFFIPAGTSIIWVSTSYIIAPSHKHISIWVSYVLGCFTVLYVCCLIFGENDFKEWESMTFMFFSAAIPGFLYSYYLEKINTIKTINQRTFKFLEKLYKS